jgi:hypothetical protein
MLGPNQDLIPPGKYQKSVLKPICRKMRAASSTVRPLNSGVMRSLYQALAKAHI